MSTSKSKNFTRAKNLDLQAAEDFINAAEKATTAKSIAEVPIQETSGQETEKGDIEAPPKIEQPPPTPVQDLQEKLPWYGANERVLKGVNLRLTEIQWAKLRFIVDNTPFSIQKYIMNILEPAMEETIKRILNAPKLY